MTLACGSFLAREFAHVAVALGDMAVTRQVDTISTISISNKIVDLP